MALRTGERAITRRRFEHRHIELHAAHEPRPRRGVEVYFQRPTIADRPDARLRAGHLARKTKVNRKRGAIAVVLEEFAVEHLRLAPFGTDRELGDALATSAAAMARITVAHRELLLVAGERQPHAVLHIELLVGVNDAAEILADRCRDGLQFKPHPPEPPPVDHAADGIDRKPKPKQREDAEQQEQILTRGDLFPQMRPRDVADADADGVPDERDDDDHPPAAAARLHAPRRPISARFPRLNVGAWGARVVVGLAAHLRRQRRVRRSARIPSAAPAGRPFAARRSFRRGRLRSRGRDCRA